MRKILSLALLAAIVPLLGACSGDFPNGGKSNSSASPAPSSAPGSGSGCGGAGGCGGGKGCG